MLATIGVAAFVAGLLIDYWLSQTDIRDLAKSIMIWGVMLIIMQIGYCII